MLPMVDQLLAEAGVSPTALDAIAFGQGPGSFTGLRIGFGIVQGLAYGIDLPVIGVSTLEAMASRAVDMWQLHHGIIVPVLDARMNEVFLAIYRVVDQDDLNIVLPDCSMTLQRALELVLEPVAAAVGDGWKLLDSHKAEIVYKETDLAADAHAVSRLGLDRFVRREYVAIEEAELVYIRNEVSWKKRQKFRLSQSGGKQ